MQNVNRASTFTKALHLLDDSQDEEAVALLSNILTESSAENDLIHVVRSSCILGEYYFNAGNLTEAKKHLEIATNAEVNEDQAAIVDYELNQAKKMLKRIG